jgi:hypothetical protein
LAIGESAKSNILKEENNTGFEEKAGDIPKQIWLNLILTENCCKKGFAASSRDYGAI